MANIDPKVFCTLPFVHISNRVDGHFTACCHAYGVVEKPDGTPYRIADGDTFEEVFRSPYMQSLRENMLKGVRDDRCRMCWKLEDQGIQSKRMHDGNRYLESSRDRLDLANLPFKPLSWDIKLGSHCNLKCRMCNPHTSTAVMMEAIDQGWFQKEDGRAYAKAQGNLLQYPRLKEELKRVVEYAQEIYFLGGEPSLIPEHLEIIDAAIAMGLTEKLTLRWSTNLTNFDERFVERAKLFKKVVVDCSIDGFGEVNEYIRSPLKWSLVERRLSEIRSAAPRVKLKVVCTVQTYNIFRLDEILAWGARWDIPITFNFLNYPDFLSVEALPNAIRHRLIARYREFANPQMSYLIRWLEGTGDGDLGLRAKFFEFTEKLDKVRGQDFFALVPDEFRADMLALKAEAVHSSSGVQVLENLY